MFNCYFFNYSFVIIRHYTPDTKIIYGKLCLYCAI